MAVIQRQWRLVRLLAHGTYTLRELREQTGTTGRTIRRDFLSLRSAGFDLQERVEKHGRKVWRITRKTIPRIA